MRLLILLGVALVLAGCGTPPDVGKGEVMITPAVQARYQEFQELDGRAYFAISTDGKGFGYSFCSNYRCARGGRALAISSCEIRSKGIPCKIYADRSGVVWDGPTVVGSKP